MPGLKLTVSMPQLDRDAYIRALQATVTDAIIKSARKFLAAAAPLVPVWTGFARGAFANLEDVVGRVSNAGIITPSRGSRSKLIRGPAGNKAYYYYPGDGTRIVRTNLSSRPFATKSSDIISEGRLTKATIGSRIVFKFSININYFNYLDDTRWHAFEAGRKAFNTELKAQLTKLPQIGKYVVRREIT